MEGPALSSQEEVYRLLYEEASEVYKEELRKFKEKVRKWDLKESTFLKFALVSSIYPIFSSFTGIGIDDLAPQSDISDVLNKAINIMALGFGSAAFGASFTKNSFRKKIKYLQEKFGDYLDSSVPQKKNSL